MTVADNYEPLEYTGNGVTTSFPFSWTISNDGELVVISRVIATGVDTIVPEANYTVVGSFPGTGSITYEPGGAPLAATHKLIIARSVDFSQEMDITSQGGFHPTVLENQLDALERQIQQIREEVGRAPKLRVKTAVTDFELPEPVSNLFLGWNNDADGLENKTSGGIAGEVLPAVASTLLRRNVGNTAFETISIADQATAEAGVDNDTLMTPLRTKQEIDVNVVRADQAEAEAGTDNSDLMTPLRTSQAIAIHRNYYDLVRDFGAVADTGADQRAAFVAAFTAIAAVGGKRRLYVPKGVYRLDYNTSVSLTPPVGIEIFGDGPEDTIIEVVNTTVVGTRTIFTITNSDVTFHPSLTIRMTQALSITGSTWLVCSLGGASNFVFNASVEGGVGFLNAPPDNTLTHSVMVLQRQDSLFEGIYVDNCLWNSTGRGYLNDHLQLNAITRRVRFGSKFRATNMYREFIAINAPNVESSDWRFEGGRTQNNWDRSAVASHLAIGNGRDIRIEGWHFEGAGAAIHTEETANGQTIKGCTATLSSTGAKFLRLFANNVAGGTSAPTGLCVIGNRAKTSAGATADSRGIYWGNNALGAPCNNSTFVGNIMSQFERGYSQDESPVANIVANNIAANCTVGFRINTGATAIAKALHTYNHAQTCGTPYVDAGGGAVPWGTGNTSA